MITKCVPVTINAFQSWYQYQKRRRSTHSQESFVINERPSTFLDFAKAEYRGHFIGRIVDDVKSLRGAIVVFTLLIPYWLVYDQVGSFIR